MKYKSVPLSQIARHPRNSLSAKDHIGDPDHVKALINDGKDKSLADIIWMINEGVITKEDIEKFTVQITQSITAPIFAQLARIKKTTDKILGIPTKPRIRQYDVDDEEWYTSLGFAIAFFGSATNEIVGTDSITFEIESSMTRIKKRLEDFDVIIGEDHDENTKQIAMYSTVLASIWNKLVDSDVNGYQHIQLLKQNQN